MKKLIILFLGILGLCSNVRGQAEADIGKIVVGIDVMDNASPETLDLKECLINKLNAVVAYWGCSSLGYTDFVLTPNLLIEDVQVAEGGMKNVYVVKGYLYLNIIERNGLVVFASRAVKVKGVATDKNKAIKDAVLNLDLGDLSLVAEAKKKMEVYYVNHKDVIFRKAEFCANQGHFAEAIAILLSLPDEFSDLKQEAYSRADNIYRKQSEYLKLEYARNVALHNDSVLVKAKSLVAMHSPQEALRCLWDYQTASTKQDENYQTLVAQAAAQVSAEERRMNYEKEREYRDRKLRENRQWALAFQNSRFQHNVERQRLDNAYKLSEMRIKAMKTVAVEFLKTQPKHIIYY